MLKRRPEIFADEADINETPAVSTKPARTLVIMCGAGCRAAAKDCARSDRLKVLLIHSVKGKDSLPKTTRTRWAASA
jgi:hypothetical protein